MASIYVVRHGQASFGEENYDKLSTLGCRQAEVLGEYFRDCGIYFDATFSGDLQRQRKTAKLAIASQPGSDNHPIDTRFNELNNEELYEDLGPENIANNPALTAIDDRALTSRKDYQNV